MRITGLVRAARIVREQLAAGIPPEHAGDFRQRVHHTVEQVDAICREHNVKLQDLPTPSYQAYRYLASLDLDALPLRQGETPQRPQTVYVTRVVTAQNDVNALFYDWAADPKHQATKLSTKHSQVRRFARLLAEHVDEIEALAREQGGEPAHLPTRSRRAYQWLKFLSEPTTLLAHLETLRALLGEFHTPHCRAKPRQTVAQVGFALAQHLYIARPSAAGLRVTIHEGFRRARLRAT
ncbi:MAG: hypothetical protein JXA14_12045 [Anaerolineae bacterium]|nr:hypothetical protein [Anaerolineae bacterium]